MYYQFYSFLKDLTLVLFIYYFIFVYILSEV